MAKAEPVAAASSVLRWSLRRGAGLCQAGGGRLALLHYFQKTVENFLSKRDVSLPHRRQRADRRTTSAEEPSGIRSLCAMYDNGRFGQARDCRSVRRFPFAAAYLRDVAILLERTADWGDAGRAIRMPPRRVAGRAASDVHDLFRGV